MTLLLLTLEIYTVVGIEKRGLGPKPPMVERGHPKHYIAKAGGSHAIQFGVQSC